MAIREETGDYEPYYMISYRLAYGDFEDDDMLNTESERVIFVLASVLMPLVLLNLLIAIMGDYYDQIQSKYQIADIWERLSLINEVGKFAFWLRSSDFKFIHWCSTDLLKRSDQLEEWEGKVKEIKSAIRSGAKKSTEDVKILRKQVQTSEANVIANLQKSGRGVYRGADPRIGQIERKLEDLDRKMDSILTKLR